MLLVSISLIILGMISTSEPLPHHRCVHDEVAVKDLPMVRSDVGISHGAMDRHSRMTAGSNGNQERHQNDRDSQLLFKQVRITPFFVEPLDPSVRDKLTNSSGPLMRAINVMSSVLLVRPLRENLTLTPMCSETFNSGVNLGSCSNLNPRTMCGIFPVPDQFVGRALQCGTPDDSSTCSEEGPDGDGLATDFLIFVGTDSQQEHCGSSTFTFSSSCAMDGYHRPTAGYINVCAEHLLHNNVLKVDDTTLYNTLLHELIHVLGFSRHRLSDFHDGNLNFYNPQVTSTYSGNEITGIRSPKVLEVGRSYFGCTDLPYIPWENNGDNSAENSHWEARVLHHESMVAFIPNDYSVLSNFTLAYFEDSGWYKVNYTSLKSVHQLELLWGKGLGCPFVLEQCTEETYPYLCNTNMTYQCTFDLVSKGKCSDRSTNQFFDGCAVVIPGDKSSSCIRQQNSYPTMEMPGASSLCVDVELTSTAAQYTFPFCFGYQYFNGSNIKLYDVQTTVFNQTLWCNSSTENKLAYEMEFDTNESVKVYCPVQNQLNVRLALVGQAVYQVDGNPPNVVNEEEGDIPNEMNSTTWAGILVASMAILFVMICFGIPLCLIAIKAINCTSQVESDDTLSADLSRSDSNLTEIVIV